MDTMEQTFLPETENVLESEHKSVDFDLFLPYVSAELAGIGGQIRESVEHFVVEEIPLYEAQGDGQHLYINLTKEGLTTRDIQHQLARLFQVGPKMVGFAGMKDKHARTTQTFSINVGHVDQAFVEEAPARIQSELPVTVHWARLHQNKLKPGHLLGNRFTITITGIGDQPGEALAQAQEIIQSLKSRGVPNYFGPQRLGVNGSNVRQGLSILQGRRKSRDPWTHRFMITCYQSYLCNRYLAQRLEKGFFDHLLTGDVAKKHATGGMFDVADATVEQPRYTAQEISFTAPIYGPKMWEAQAESGHFEQEVLAQSAVTLRDFQQARMTGTRRLGRLLLPDIGVELTEAGLVVAFFLPKGAFATTVLREIMKVDLAYVPESESD